MFLARQFLFADKNNNLATIEDVLLRIRMMFFIFMKGNDQKNLKFLFKRNILLVAFLEFDKHPFSQTEYEPNPILERGTCLTENKLKICQCFRFYFSKNGGSINLGNWM